MLRAIAICLGERMQTKILHHATAIQTPYLWLLCGITCLMLLLATTQAKALTVTYNDETKTAKQQEAGEPKITLYGDIRITHSANFQSFNTYLSENRESYRSRRATELRNLSQTPFGNDVEMAHAMMTAYRQFDDDYTNFKAQSTQGVGLSLSNQLKATLTRLREEHMIQHKDAKFYFTHGKWSTFNMNGKLYPNQVTQNLPASKIAEVANTFIYGYWDEIDKDNINLTVMIEPVTGEIHTFAAVGAATGEAASLVANQMFLYLQGRKNYEPIKNPIPHLSIKQPIKINDVKTHGEAVTFCEAQSMATGESYRLPYSSELLAMPGQYHKGGVYFVDTKNKSYAVADNMGSFLTYKLTPANKAGDTVRLQKADPNEKLSYFCVKGKATNHALELERLYAQLRDHIKLFREQGHNFDKATCQNANNVYMRSIKDSVIAIKRLNPAFPIEGVIRACVVRYLKIHDLGRQELNLVGQGF